MDTVWTHSRKIKKYRGHTPTSTTRTTVYYDVAIRLWVHTFLKRKRRVITSSGNLQVIDPSLDWMKDPKRDTEVKNFIRESNIDPQRKLELSLQQFYSSVIPSLGRFQRIRLDRTVVHSFGSSTPTFVFSFSVLLNKSRFP